MAQTFTKLDVCNYSMKNIPIPSHKEYTLALIHSVEKFVRNLRWRSFFFLNPQDKPSKETYGFKSIRAAPKIKELQEFENRLKGLCREIEFRGYSNDFQQKLKDDLANINNNAEVIVSADKTSNHYLVDTEKYNDLVVKNIQKDFKKAAPGDIKKALEQQKEIVTKLDIDDRVLQPPPQDSYITLKDQKSNFQNDPKARLLNPQKPEIGRISKKIVSRVVGDLRSKTNLNLWKNTDSVITWFTKLQDKRSLRFISFDICDYYGSITQELFKEAVDWARTIVPITPTEVEVIFKSKQTFLSYGGQTWKKKGDDQFNISMGSWDGAESTDIVGLFLLSKMQALKDAKPGLYRDDGLLVTRGTPRNTEKLKQDLTNLFSKYKLKLTLDCNHKIINFLDVTFNLDDGLYRPYMKENNIIRYINTKSNHPKEILKNIPQNINNRLSRNSANETIFNESKQPYQDALKESGFDYSLKFDPSVKLPQQQQQSSKRTRSRKVTWFNPPFSLNVKTNVGATFLKMIKEYFPPNHKLHKICNKNTLKISYRTMPNMRKHVSKHNNKILKSHNHLQNPEVDKAPHCNCQNRYKGRCPLPGKCNISNVVYRGHITRTDTGHTEHYTGASVNFKKRWYKHLETCTEENAPGQTTLSSYIWSDLKTEDGTLVPHTITWDIRDRGPPYNPTTDVCRLCLLEKYYILKEPSGATLNQRSEFFCHCYHKEPQLLVHSVK